MRDAVLDGFLRDQFLRGMELAEQSDLLRLQPLFESSEPPTRYLARFNCMGVVRGDDGAIGPVESQFVVGIAFRQDHLRTADPLRVITWLDPPTVVHPNVLVPHFARARRRGYRAGRPALSGLRSHHLSKLVIQRRLESRSG